MSGPNTCVACGEIIPEGMMVCINCSRIARNTCGGCADRTVTPNCHTNCDRYQISTRVKAAIRLKKRYGVDADNFTYDNVTKTVRKRHQNGAPIRKGIKL